MPKNDNANACTSHDWVASLVEAGLDACAWPRCKATRETPAADVEPSASVVVVVLEDRRAA